MTALLTYCQGTEMDRCKSCKHGEAWADLHQLPDALRRVIQKEPLQVNRMHCEMNRGGLYAVLSATKELV